MNLGMTSNRGKADKEIRQNKMEVGAETSVIEAIALWKRKLVFRRAPNILAIAILAAFTYHGWASASLTTRILVVLFGLGFVFDSIHVAWSEWHDPALGTYDGGVLKFYWISGRSMEVSMAQVRRVRAHENPYWQIRRVYPKWFELEIAGEPSKVIVSAFNLKPQAREVLERMSKTR